MSTTFQALSGRARWAVVALVAVIGADLITIGSDWLEIDLMNRVLDGEDVTFDELDSNDVRQGVVALVLLGALVAATILFIRWFHLAYRNLVPLGVPELRFKPGWAIGSWFVPILNLWRPKQIANDIWRGSDPGAPAEQGGGWTDRRTPALLAVWWGAWLLTGFVANAAARLWFRSDTPEDLRDAATLDAVSSGIDIAAALLAIVLIRRLTARQQERAGRLGAVEDQPVAGEETRVDATPPDSVR